MKCLVIGGNRFVGLRLVHILDQLSDLELHVINRTGQVAHTKNAVIHKGDRRNLDATFLDRDWDLIIDFACFNEEDATASLKYFRKVKRYILISTVSVYDQLGNLKEEDFDPAKFDLAVNAPEPGSYQNGKRRAEATFAQKTKIPTLSVRFPVILGPDDYTHRLDFHVERTQRSEEIYVPNLSAKISMIYSQDAAEFLLWSLTQTQLTGPVNVSSMEPISLTGLLGQIELVTGKKTRLAQAPLEGNESPYGSEKDFFVNTEKLRRAGFNPRPIADWLPGLIGKPPSDKPKFVH